MDLLSVSVASVIDLESSALRAVFCLSEYALAAAIAAAIALAVSLAFCSMIASYSEVTSSIFA